MSKSVEYVVGIEPDGRGHCLTSRENWEKTPIHKEWHREVSSFHASSWEEAKMIYEAFMKRYTERMSNGGKGRK